ncbi:hypothetical protein H4R34_000444 [Dimargaris verticillata]|uniref:TRP C-terminal domain-containing protein n=1 Tax=Dimargaris verticillata TaxID=2761393 RepID=A0A9W8B674_9FUNG|nr:hypothetical protein H4R34_000444 [Dimargaris verticillata]
MHPARAQDSASSNGTLTTLNVSSFENCDANLPIQFNIPRIEYSEGTGLFDLRLSVNSDREISGGSTNIQLSALNQQVAQALLDTCALAATACPIGSGDQQLEHQVRVPANLVSLAKRVIDVPGVWISGQVNIRGVDGDTLGCLNFKVNGDKSFNSPIAAAVIGAVLAVAALIALGANLLANLSLPEESTTASSGRMAEHTSVSPAALGSGNEGLVLTSVAVGLTAAGKANTFSGPFPGLLELMTFVQFATSTGALSLQYPALYRQFATNFSWTLGIANVPFLNDIFSRVVPVTTASSSVTGRSLMARQDNITAILSSSKELGIEKYAREIGLPSEHIFPSMLSLVILVLLATVVICILVRGIVALIAHYRPFKLMTLRRYYIHWSCGMLLRIYMLAYLPLAAVCFLQVAYLQTDTGQVVLASILLALLGFGLVIYFAVVVFKAGSLRIYGYDPFLYAYGALYTSYKKHSYGFFVPLFVYRLILAVVIGTAGGASIVQVAILAANELIYLLLVALRRPFVRRLEQVLTIFMGLIRLVIAGLLFTFIPSFNVNDLVQLIVGAICIALQILAMLLLVILLVYSTVMAIREASKTPKTTPSPGASASRSVGAFSPGDDGSPLSAVGENTQLLSPPLSPATLTRDRSVVFRDSSRSTGSPTKIAPSEPLGTKFRRKGSLFGRWTHSPTAVANHRSSLATSTSTQETSYSPLVGALVSDLSPHTESDTNDYSDAHTNSYVGIGTSAVLSDSAAGARHSFIEDPATAPPHSSPSFDSTRHPVVLSQTSSFNDLQTQHPMLLVPASRATAGPPPTVGDTLQSGTLAAPQSPTRRGEMLGLATPLARTRESADAYVPVVNHMIQTRYPSSSNYSNTTHETASLTSGPGIRPGLLDPLPPMPVIRPSEPSVTASRDDVHYAKKKQHQGYKL